MKIAILGSRGIPNNYGGFEQFAEILSHELVQAGHEVVVYNPSDHGYPGGVFRGVKLIRIFSSERHLRFLNTFVFDFLCMLDARKRDFDVWLQLGYHPAALFYWLSRGTRARIITNMAGMEWWRSKWNRVAKAIIRCCERKAVRQSHALVADNEGIARYYKATYGTRSAMIAYGAVLFDNPDTRALEDYGLEPGRYYMLVARFQSDNNIEMVLDGYISSSSQLPFLVVGGCENSYGQYLQEKYRGSPAIRFVGGIYDYEKLSSLRWYCKLYFHGHTSGGTNPSLLEAMASNAGIAAHDNEFNRAVLQDGGDYFANSQQVAALIHQDAPHPNPNIHLNRRRIAEVYSWEKITREYEQLFREVVGENHKGLPSDGQAYS